MTSDDPLAPSTDDAADPDPGSYGDRLPQSPRDGDPQPGDPPAQVRGAKQVVSDPPGDAADDGARRWDPRTQTAEQREGG